MPMTVRHDGAERRLHWSPSRRLAAHEMEGGPPEPACRSRRQITCSCGGQESLWEARRKRLAKEPVR
jgi:hypothetical protein